MKKDVEPDRPRHPISALKSTRPDRPSSQTRRTEGIRNEGRAARVVAAVLTSTAEQLSRVGFAALRIEDVATQSGVNKTTIYRRWPTRADLVVATLRSLKSSPLPDTGSLREDVLAWFREHDAFARSPVGSGIVRMIQTERAHPELEAIARSFRSEQRVNRRTLVTRAIARGELSSHLDAGVVADLIFAPIAACLFIHGERIEESYVEALLDIVLRGGQPSPKKIDAQA